VIKIIQRSGWLAGGLIFFMPVLLIFFLGSQSAYSQVKGRFEAYQNMPEITRLSELTTLSPGRVVILRGQISQTRPGRALDPIAPELIIYQERPTAGREVRFQEDFPLVFPEFVMALADGSVVVSPSQAGEHIIQGELHTVADGDRVRTGFRIGDMVTVQGQWQPQPGPTVIDVTGITGADRASFMADWEKVFQLVGWVRNGLGLLTILSLVILVVQLRRIKRQPETANEVEGETCPPQTPETIPTA
jgi:hypothetical protein